MTSQPAAQALPVHRRRRLGSEAPGGHFVKEVGVVHVRVGGRPSHDASLQRPGTHGDVLYVLGPTRRGFPLRGITGRFV